MPDFSSLLGFVLTSLLLALSPGPDNFYVLVKSASLGFRAGFLVTLGLCTGLLVHTSIVAGGLAVAMTDHPDLVKFLQLVGAGYLLFISTAMWRSMPLSLFGQPDMAGGVSLYRRGVLLNLTNPKVSLFFLFFLPQFVVVDRWPAAWQLVCLGVLFIASAFLVFGLIAWFGAKLTPYLHNNPHWLIRLNRVAALCLGAVAFNMIFSSLGVNI